MPGPAKMAKTQWPEDIGIIAMEIYFPSQYVDQSELEDFDGISKGKYTIGLGQSKMGFCSDREDINSLSLTVVQMLMEKNKIPYSQVGHLGVGTETIIDKSKSVKSVVMQLFEDSGNTNIEGVDTTNACYGGTAALFNAINWIESSSWDGRYALVVAADIAVYATGNARCTGGAGAVAMLIGTNAPLVFDRGVRGIHMQHVYDFYKPDLSSEYPVVDGKLSVKCYQHAVDKCYEHYSTKAQSAGFKHGPRLLDAADAFIFHSPYCKLVQKSCARLLFNDLLREHSPDYNDRYRGLEEYKELKFEDSYFNRDAEKAFMSACDPIFQQKTKPSLLLANQVGNMYTPSVYGGLASFIVHSTVEDLAGKRLVLFSYGSGLASSMFSIKVTDNVAHDSALHKVYENLSDIPFKLGNRIKIPPVEFDKIMKLREETHNAAPYTPTGSVDHLFPGTWYLTSIDNMHRRKYERKPSQSIVNGDVAVNCASMPRNSSLVRCSLIMCSCDNDILFKL
ncbi:hypothetical protein FSP39_024243 [Pinctada imbricata]|uniref:Hydroxymethylglutaryl-CoA synthase n=1 Tax=Pinctada imbricata TaxID=66713 RepID=A0AA88XU79_PINIB|nr:hypothetical protein FSP39_024243 [Pinctada imbricata]